MSSRGTRVERCAVGRLRDSYPVHSHDVEIRVPEQLRGPGLSAELQKAARDALAEDPRCRRVVYSAPADDPSAREAAIAAGFRFVVDVDLPGQEVSLFVLEPAWVTTVDMDLDRVPGT